MPQPPELSLEELAELERLALAAASANLDKAVPHETVMVLSSQFKYALLDHGPKLVAMARELVRLKSAIRWREANRFRAELQGRPVEEFLADSVVLGWLDPTTKTEDSR